ncbi:MAG: POTRA domain-containing protein, partial [Pseudomonadota bacterium]
MSSQTTRLGLVRRGIALSLLMAPVLAAPPIPDAGRLLRDIERSTGKRDLAPAPRLPPEQPVPAASLPEPSGESVFVKSFNIRPAQPPEAPADSPPPVTPQTTPVVPTPPKKFPDAGRQPFLLPMNRPVPAMQLPERPGQAVFVESFNIHSTRFSQHELRTLLKGYSGRALTLNEFQEATRKIDEYYRQHDTPGHAYLPPQVVRQGVVDMLVVEGRLAQASATPIPRRDAKPVATLAESSAPPEPPRPAALDEKALQALIKDYAGRALTLNELQEAARKISDYYRQHDYLAHAYLPPQTVRDGVVEIIVVEGRLGQVRVDPASPTRMNQPLVTGIIERRVPPGQPLRPAALDEAVA